MQNKRTPLANVLKKIQKLKIFDNNYELSQEIQKGLELYPKNQKLITEVKLIMQNSLPVSEKLTDFQAAVILYEATNYDTAMHLLDNILKQNKNNVEALTYKGICLFNKADFVESNKIFVNLCTTQPTPKLIHYTYWYLTKLYLCDFQDREQIKLSMLKCIDNDDVTMIRLFDANITIDSLAHRKKVITNNIKYIQDNKSKFSHHKNIDIKQKIKIGYISVSFYTHPVGILINKLLNQHSKDKFEVHLFCCYLNNQHDPIFQSLNADHNFFHQIQNLTSYDQAQYIYNQNIDILIDLDGSSPINSLNTLAYQPSPIQCTWLGIMTTSGAEFIQYFISDKYIINENNAQHYSESVLRLPMLYAMDCLPAPTIKLSKKNFSLPEDKFIFFCSSANYKISSALLTSWAKILNNAPNAVLWIRYRKMNDEKLLAYEYLISKGVNKQQLVFTHDDLNLTEGWHPTLAHMWLDTFDFSSGVGGSISLAMGIPILAYNGELPQQRIISSTLQSLGLNELITTNSDEYIKQALYFYNNYDQYLSLREKIRTLQKNKHSFFNRKSFMQQFEAGIYKIIEHNSLNDVDKNKVIDV